MCIQLAIEGVFIEPNGVGVNQFKDKAKRAKLIDKLLDEDEGYVRNFSTIWTNNLIGRAPPPAMSGNPPSTGTAPGRNAMCGLSPVTMS